MAYKIIDVSEHQGKIDWEKAKKEIDGAIIRIGYGDDIKSQDDKYANYNMDECERLGIPYATYLYSYANTEAHVKSEIAHEQRMTRGRKTVCHYLDLEERGNKGIWKFAAKAWIAAFSSVGMYSWQWAFEDQLKGLKCKVWIAAYGKNTGKPDYAYKPTINCDGWQFTSKAKISGISGYVDVSEWYTAFGKASTPKTPEPSKNRIVKKKEVAALIMKHLCTHSGHGYTQDMSGRQGTGTETIDIYGKKYTIKAGDRDCSSAVITAYEAAGISCGGATYTGNMKPCMVSTGNFKWRPMSFIAQMGDTYLNEDNHTAMCLSAEPDVLMEFSINEKGGTLGGKIGDQKQVGEYDEHYGRGESHLKLYYDYPWNGILECVNDEVAFIITESDTIQDVPASNVGDNKNVTNTKQPITISNKSDNELAIEAIFGAHGSGDERKKALGGRYKNVQDEVNDYWKNVSKLVAGIKVYLKKFGPDNLIK